MCGVIRTFPRNFDQDRLGISDAMDNTAIIFVLLIAAVVNALPNHRVFDTNKDANTDPGEPLFLSQYLPSNPDLARKLSAVQGLGDFESYSGMNE